MLPFNVELAVKLYYHIYSCVSHPTYKPTPFPTAKNLAIISDPHVYAPLVTKINDERVP